MERNLTFARDTAGRVRIKLSWAQADIVAAKGDDFQLIIAGDEDSVNELRVEQADGELVVAQPQLAYAKEILPRRRWLQICLRVPQTWKGDLDIDTVSGTVSVHDITGDELTITTVSGSMSVRDVTSTRLGLHTVSGAISGEHITADRTSLRGVSSKATLSGATLRTTKVFTISGSITLDLESGSRSLDMQSVSGSLCVETDSPVKAALHSLSGQFLLSDDVQSATEGTPLSETLDISASSVSGDLAVKRRNNDA